MRRWILTGLLAVIVIGGALYGFHWYTVGRFVENTDNAYVEADIAYIAPKVAGYVRAVPVSDNQLVKRGDILLLIDDADFQAKAAQAEAAVAMQKAELATIAAQKSAQIAIVRQAQAGLSGSQADLQKALKDQERYQSLVRSKWISPQRFEVALAEAKRAQANVAQAQAVLSGSNKQFEVLDARREASGAALKQAEAQLKAAQIDLENTILRAPADGTIGNRSARVGQYVRPGSVVMAVVPLGGIYVVANFKETQLENIRTGQEAILEADAYPGMAVKARVNSVAPASGSQFSVLPPENATGNFTKIVQRVPVKLTLGALPAGMRLVPGMSVVVKIDTRRDSRG